jgi:S-layer family protein
MKAKTVSLALIGLGFALMPPLAIRAQSARDPSPRTYGTKDRVLYRMPAAEFLPTSSSAGYADAFESSTEFRRFLTSGTSANFLATPHLPAGALVDYVELDYCDSDPDTVLGTPIDVVLNVYDCNFLGSGCAPLKSLASSNGNVVNTGCGYVSDATLAYTVDNNTRELMLDVLLFNDSQLTSLAGAIVGYHLQVSPPSGQTFGDVPSNYLYYKAIEALAASGIASGCGNGNYCPDQAVTRGEMAKFLTNALGLRWPN